MKKYKYVDEFYATSLFLIMVLIIKNTHLPSSLFEYVNNSYNMYSYILLLLAFGFTTSLYALKKNFDLKNRNKDLLSSYSIDFLTGLGNREAFLSEKKIDKTSYVVILNIIDFKTVNKTLGFDKADRVLKDVAAKLSEIIKMHANSTLYRLYGDEFVFLCKEENIKNICEGIKSDFEDKLLSFDDVEIHLGLNIALSNEKPRYVTSTHALIECKKSLNNNILFYDNTKYDKTKQEKKLYYLKILKNAILKNTIIPVYHSIIDNKTNKIFEYETLARIRQEDGTLLSPFFFIELSKKFKLYPHITKTIIEKAFQTFENKEHGFTINFSYIDIHNDEMLVYFYNKLEENKETAKRLTIEVLETENITDYSELIVFRNKIKEYGCSLAIDDFGSGYSNWVNIFKLKPDFIKIDGSLIQNLLVNDDNINLVRTIVNFAKENNIKTIAEFVSNEELAVIVKNLDIDYSQGYYYSEPKILD